MCVCVCVCVCVCLCDDSERALAVVTTLAGGVNGTKAVYFDASGSNAGFYNPTAVAVDVSGNVFVADSYNQRIRKVTVDGGTRIGPGTLHARVADSHVVSLA